MHIFGALGSYTPTFNTMFIANGSKAATNAPIALVLIQLKVYGLIIKTLRKLQQTKFSQSGNNFAYVTTAQLSWYD